MRVPLKANQGRAIALSAALLLVILAAAPAASAAPCPVLGIDYGVSTKTDENDATPTDSAGADGELSLREAVNAANTDGRPSTIDLPAGSYKLTAGTLNMGANCSLTLNGQGARTTVIDGDGAHSVLTTTGPTQVNISGLTITGGFAHNADGGQGGGIRSSGPLNLTGVSIRGNQTGFVAGGIWSSSTLMIRDSTIADNVASPPSDLSSTGGYGGGMYASGTATLVNTTVSGNTSDPGQSGSGYAGGVANQGTLHLVSSTIANNVAAPKGGVAGARGHTRTPVTTVDRLNTLFVGGSPQNCYGLGGPISSPSSGDKSKASDATCVGPATAGLRLGPLQDNGGPTDTHALLTGNPAIDGGESACPTGTEPTTDQRGIARPQGKCDVGAFEVVKSANLAVTMSGSPRTVGQGAPSGITYSIKVRSTGPALDATQPVVTDALPAGTRLLHSSSSQGSCAGQRTISCRLGLLANGGSASVTLHVRVDKSLGTASNTAVVSSPRPEAAHADDRATVHTAISPSDGNDKITGTH